MLTLQHSLPFAVMSDQCIAKIEQCRENGEDFTIKCWLPKDPETILFLGAGVRIATVVTQETDDAPDNQTVA
ncbi:hypothetical protein D3C71_1357580 [compost metagenome]